MIKFSIIICTYNPNYKIFSRLLNSISNFDKLSPEHEIIIIDNNSKPSIDSFDYINDFIVSHLNCRLIIEEKPGLTNARIAGIKEAKADWIIFFDDDNEPSSDYLIEAEMAISQYPNVGAWGPGNINVDYFGKGQSWALKYKHLFQQRTCDKIVIDKNYSWQDCYPFGTGFMLLKNICDEYVYRVEIGEYLLIDRKESSLSSGGDLQMIFTALRMGFYVGILPNLKINHLICSYKLTLIYIGKMLYGTASSNLPAYYQCFPELAPPINYHSNLYILKKFYYYIKVILFTKGFVEFYFQLSHYLGELEGLIIINSQNKKPFFVKKVEQILFLV